MIVQRGGRQLTIDELELHMASALRLENVGAFLGAGASIDAGGQTMSGLWKAFLEESPEASKVFAAQRFVDEEDIQRESFTSEPSRKVPNIEHLLDMVQIAEIDWYRRKPTSRNLRKLIQAREELMRAVLRASLLSKSLWLDPSQRVTALSNHVRLLQGLSSPRQPGQTSPWIFTTNYDLALEWASEAIGLHAHTGFFGIHDRLFSPQSFDIGLRNTQARGEARFGANDVYLVKLHGSLSWRRISEFEFREVASSEAWGDLRSIADGEAPPSDSLMVFPRAAKYLQTVGYLSGELFRRFSDFLSRPQSFLIVIGYSFSDEHVNRLLKSALLNPTLHIVIFLPEYSDSAKPKCEQAGGMISELSNLRSPRVTIVGGDVALFHQLVELLPDPVLYDREATELRDRIVKLRQEPDE